MILTIGLGTSTRVRLAYVGIGIAGVVAVAWGLATIPFGDRVLHRVTAPGGGVVAVCQADAGLDGGYTMRLERPGTGETRTLYAIGDGDPCSEVVWSPDGRILAVLSEHVGRTRFVDVDWAVAHPGIQTAYWSWRQVDLSTERRRVRGSGLRFVGPQSVEIQTCSVDSVGACVGASARRIDIPVPIVTSHNVNPG